VKIKIGNTFIGPGERAFLIAEIGVNHNGSIALAKKLIDKAYQAKVDAVKFQTFSADRLVTRNAPQAKYQEENTKKDQTQYQLLKRLELTPDDFYELKKHCQQLGIQFLSSPFDEEAVNLLEEIGVEAYKIPSGEITNLPYLAHVASKNKPVILSTGMATIPEITEAVKIIKSIGNQEIILLQCTSSYPTKPEDANLRVMDTLRSLFNCPVGFSDHTLGCEIAIAAVAMGADVVEKHFTLDKSMEGPDHKASINPKDLIYLVQSIRKIEAAIGDGKKIPTQEEKNISKFVRKSIYANQDIHANERITNEKLVIQRPGDGLPPSALKSILGKKAKVTIKKGTKITLRLVK
jgi:N-acetylneuraminate synthase